MSKKIFFVFILAITLLGSCQEDFDHHLQREAKAYTEKHCPLNIEEGNTLDSATYDISTRTYTQWFTFSGFLDSPKAHETSLANLDKLKAQALRALRGDTKWGTCKDEGINFTYVYYSSSQKNEIFRITLTPNDYRR